MDLEISSSRDKHARSLFKQAQILEGMSEMPKGRMTDAGTTKRSVYSDKRAIKLSRQARNLLMAHMHIFKMSKKKGNVPDEAVTSPF